MKRPRARRLTLLAVLTAATIGAAACGSSTTPGQGQPTPGQSSTTGSPTATPTATPVSCPGGWRTGPLTVTRQIAVPPVPVATGIRTGTHSDCRFDRLVIDISGVNPGYSVSFVSQVTHDPSGTPVRLPGSTFLLIRLTPAQGHGATGATELPQHVQLLSYPMLRGYAVAGDFEGVLSVGLGLAGGTRYRVGELPGRIYIDVAW